MLTFKVYKYVYKVKMCWEVGGLVVRRSPKVQKPNQTELQLYV